MTITRSHVGSPFFRGQTGAVYVLTVTNRGGAPTSDSVSVADILPAGLTATAIRGVGWTTDFATLTATRSDALPSGASYPPITVTGNVAADAPGRIVNTAQVLGGGETNTGNNVASDATLFPITGLIAPAAQAGAAAGANAMSAAPAAHDSSEQAAVPVAPMVQNEMAATAQPTTTAAQAVLLGASEAGKADRSPASDIAFAHDFTLMDLLRSWRAAVPSA
jgi:uncharacterized repeat protein (TIGR01451 family)